MKINDLPDLPTNFPGNLPTNTVATVTPESPAALIGLQVGDQIVKIDGRAVAAHEIPEVLLEAAVPITLTVMRGDQLIELLPAKPILVEGLGSRLGFTLRGGGKTPVLLRRFLNNPHVAGVRGRV
jgi:membrane-associated protease RseP (regulator of RpoE activity)